MNCLSHFSMDKPVQEDVDYILEWQESCLMAKVMPMNSELVKIDNPSMALQTLYDIYI